MSLLTNVQKKGGLGTSMVPSSGGNLLSKYVKPLETSTPVVSPQKTLGERVSGFASQVKTTVGSALYGLGKFAAKTDVAVGQLFADTVDFSADFLSSAIETQLRGKKNNVVQPLPFLGEKKANNLADRWRSFYEKNVGNQTEALKGVVSNLSQLPSLQPSKEWSGASIQQKFSPKHLAETVMEAGPGVVASLGSFVLNPALGFTLATGSVANEINELAQEAGVEKNKALSLGLGTGLLVGYLDKIVPEEILNPEEKKMFIGALAKKVVFSGLKETGTEMTQEAAQLLVESTLRKDLSFDEVKTRVIMNGFGGFLGGAGMQGVIGFANNVKSGDIAAITQEDIKNPEVLSKVVGQERASNELTLNGTTQENNDGQVVDIEQQNINGSIEPNEYDRSIKPGKQLTPEELRVAQEVVDTQFSESGLTIGQEVKLPDGNTSKIKSYEGSLIDKKDLVVYLDNGRNANLSQLVELNPVSVSAQVLPKVMSTDELLSHIDERGGGFRTPEQIEALRKSIIDFGITYPIELTVNEDGSFDIYDGNHRIKIAKDLGITELPVKVVQDKRTTKAKSVEKVDTKPETVKVAPTQLPVGEGKQKISKLQARMQGALNATPDQIEELGLQTYNQMNQEDQIAKATEYVKNNPQEALKVITGEVSPPQGVLQNSVFKALTDAAETDLNLASQVATLAGTRFGQEINILKTILADNPAIIMQDVVQARIEAYEQKTQKKVSEIKKADFKDIQSEIKKPNKADWKSFVESIQC